MKYLAHIFLAFSCSLLLVACKSTGSATSPKPATAKKNSPATILSNNADPYWRAFVTSGFEKAPEPTGAGKSPAVKKSKNVKPEVTRLIKVEIWNLLIGQEKTNLMKKAQALGSSVVPPENQWQQWQMAAGAVESNRKKVLNFLISPELCQQSRPVSGMHMYVEIMDVGGIHIARYSAD
jgi:hypothetical protein